MLRSFTRTAAMRSASRMAVPAWRVAVGLVTPAQVAMAANRSRPLATTVARSNATADSTKLQMDKPVYQLTFTCKKCSTRSSHNVSKQAYHNGTVLIQCPGCQNRHLIADHLKIFSDERITLEDILATKGEAVTKGSIDADQLSQLGDLEWETLPKALAEKSGKD